MFDTLQRIKRRLNSENGFWFYYLTLGWDTHSLELHDINASMFVTIFFDFVFFLSFCPFYIWKDVRASLQLILSCLLFCFSRRFYKYVYVTIFVSGAFSSRYFNFIYFIISFWDALTHISNIEQNLADFRYHIV